MDHLFSSLLFLDYSGLVPCNISCNKYVQLLLLSHMKQFRRKKKLHSKNGTTQQEGYYTARMVLHSKKGITQQEWHYTARRVLHSKNGTTQQEGYYTARRALHKDLHLAL